MIDDTNDAEVTVVAPTPLTSAVPLAATPSRSAIEAWWTEWHADMSTEKWLKEHVPSAHSWWRLWRADRYSLAIAVDAAESLPETSRDRIVTEHGAAERSASLWYLSELVLAEQRTLAALSAHDAPRATVERLTSVLRRIKDLVREVRAVTAP